MKITLFCIFFNNRWPLYFLPFFSTSFYHLNITFYIITNLSFQDPSFQEIARNSPAFQEFPFNTSSSSSSSSFNFPSRIKNENIKLIQTSFSSFISSLNFKFSNFINLESNIQPYKVNDFKPLLGKLYEDLLIDSTHWGWIDLDLILTDIVSLYSPISEDFISYGKLPSQGPLMIIKNTNETRHMYLNFSSKLFKLITQSIPSSVDEIQLSLFLTSPSSSFTKKSVIGGCEAEPLWIYFQGLSTSENHPCNLIHFGGGMPTRSFQYKMTFLNVTLLLFHSNYTNELFTLLTSNIESKWNNSFTSSDIHKLISQRYVGFGEVKGMNWKILGYFFYFLIHPKTLDVIAISFLPHYYHTRQGLGLISRENDIRKKIYSLWEKTLKEKFVKFKMKTI